MTKFVEIDYMLRMKYEGFWLMSNPCDERSLRVMDIEKDKNNMWLLKNNLKMGKEIIPKAKSEPDMYNMIMLKNLICILKIMTNNISCMFMVYYEC